MEKLIDTREAARRLRCTIRHVRRLASSGIIPAIKIGRDWVIIDNDLSLKVAK